MTTLAAWRCSAFLLTSVAVHAAPTFKQDIAPIFQQACAGCHINASMGKLRLESEGAVLRGGASGPSIIPGHSSDSVLIKRIEGLTDAPRMPMGAQPLSSVQVDLIRKWIDEGSFDSKAISSDEGQATKSIGAESSLFATQIRPILAARCYGCHGPDVQQNGLRLDSLSAILKGSDNGPIVVPHESQKSRLVRRLMAQERPQMPYGGPPLSDAERSAISQWIDAGAPGPDSTTPLAQVRPQKHWAYTKPLRPAVPAVQPTGWPHNPVDNFILSRLAKEGLKPAPEASRTTLIRRVYLDLIGLPPSPQQVDAFLQDQRSDAYERVVDSLLASPRYGEKWARQWLDLARYADSNGYEKDRRRTAWEYRDWVIRALNADMSFRQFTIEQIAGDMLPDPTNDQLIATGFNRNSMLNQEGGIDINEYYYYSQVDRANTTAAVWLGSTLGCAQCHNHKFDPFPQKDYYRFLAFFSHAEHNAEGVGDRWMTEPDLPLPTAEQARQSQEIHNQINSLETKLRRQTPDLDRQQSAWELSMREAPRDWTVVIPQELKSEGGASLAVQPDGSVLASGKNPQADSYELRVKLPKGGITGVRLEVLPDAGLPHGGPGRDPAGNFFLSDFELGDVKWKQIVADDSQDGYSASRLAHKTPGVLSGWAITESATPLPRQAVFVPTSPISAEGLVAFTLKHQMRHSSRNIGHFRISVTTAHDPTSIAKIPATVRPWLEVAAERRTPEQREALSAAFREVAPALDPVREEVEHLQKQLASLGIVTAMVMREEPGFARPATYIRERGTFTSPGELVYADVPTAFNPLPKDAMPNRLGLAEWLVSDDNPLTARVTVNRYWEAIFGRGLVETSEDFGTQGDLPSHPELLDWLATEFMQGGWSPKKLQRLLVTSSTYRQDSRVTPDLVARDPYNKLYAHGPRFRVDAEIVHDMALSESGLLSPKMYGPPVFPYQPEGVWDIPYSDDKWVGSVGEDQHRRSVYTMIRRSAPYPSMVTYDAPSREFCTVRRVRTNTPLQALTSLNDPYFFDAAKAMAARIMQEGGSDVPSQVSYGFRLTTARTPSQSELERVTAFYNRELKQYSDRQKAWTMVSNVLLNMDTALTKE